MSNHKISVLIVDDQRLFAESLKYVIESRTDDIEVTGIAFDGKEAVESVRTYIPDVVLMDVRMPNIDGVEATRIIREEFTEVKIVMLTTFSDDQYIHDAVKYGALGYLLKNIPPIELITSIRAVKNGTFQASPIVAEILAKEIKNSEEVKDEIDWALNELTNREGEVLQLMLDAYENRQIARHFNITEQTVKNYVHSIYFKFDVSNRLELFKLIKKDLRF